MNDIMQQYEPVLSAISAIISLTVLGFVIRFSLLMRAVQSERTHAMEAQKGVVEERLRKSEEDLVRTEKWHQRELELQEKLSGLLAEGNLTIESLVQGPSLTNIQQEVTAAIQETLRNLAAHERQIVMSEVETRDPIWYLERAQGMSVMNEWLGAAQHYDRYLAHNPENWEAHFLRAIAYANCRSGRVTDISALRSYNEAIAFAPPSIEKNLRARLYAYRGAMLKRLNRLDEAENDLLLAQELAERKYEQEDSTYNLACVYAMRNEKGKMIDALSRLVSEDKWKQIIASKKEYFRNYWNDGDFQALIS